MFDLKALARPGSEMESVMNQRVAQFDNQFFNQLFETSQATNLNYDFYGNVSYSGSDNSFPTLEEAWNIYRTQASSRFIRANYADFKQKYDAINQQKNQKSVQDIMGASAAGVSDKKFQKHEGRFSKYYRYRC